MIKKSLLFALLWAAPAVAQKPAASLDGEFPYLTKVSKEHQQAAKALVEEGNKLLHDGFLPQAEKKYRDALALWEHPAIHYNLALALPLTLRPAEVYEHMRAAMNHGEAPIGAGRYKHARTLTERMVKEYAWVEISCGCEASAKLSSGEWLVRRGNGSFEGLVPPGTHTLVAAQKDHPSAETVLTLAAGERVHLRLGEKRPYTPWKLWAAMGAGAAVAAGGGLLHVQAGKDFRAFDNGINRCGGCEPQPGVAAHRTRALTLQRIAVGSYTLGGAAVLTGLVFLYNNQLQSQIIPSEQDGARLVIAPMFGKQGNGLLAAFQF
jgi:hypothetical protein